MHRMKNVNHYTDGELRVFRQTIIVFVRIIKTKVPSSQMIS